jgi:Ca2+-binding EF-hand superfamily protein
LFFQSSGVTFQVFQRAHLNGLLGMEGAAFRRAFAAFDHTGRGYVRLDDVLKELGPGEVADTFCELLAAVNAEGDEITLKTFIAALSVGMPLELFNDPIICSQ